MAVRRRTLAALVLLVVALWIGALMLSMALLPAWEQRGQFGDLFGSVNSLFSGLAFAGIFFAIVLQQDQIRLQRDELALQREELRLQRLEMEASRGELAKQVKAQEALVRATLAQIAVYGAQARVEAYKMSAEGRSFEVKADHAQFIEKMASSIEALADKLEVEFRNAS